MDQQQLDQVGTGAGFFAALDQSGGSTPKALALYGIPASDYSTDDQMRDLVHEMRTRIITAPSFTGERVIAAILFEDTMDRQVDGRDTGDYLWSVKRIVPFLKVDRGLAEVEHGVQLMKPMPDLDELLTRATSKAVFGTKMRSVIALADPGGIDAILDQQFAVAAQILGHGLVPIIEPEVDINSPDKEQAEELLHAGLTQRLTALPQDQRVLLKLTLPDVDNLYADLVGHPNVLRVLALSGGYTRADADAKLARNHGVIASFSRALTEGLTVQQSDADFDAALASSIQEIFEASLT